MTSVFTETMSLGSSHQDSPINEIQSEMEISISPDSAPAAGGSFNFNYQTDQLANGYFMDPVRSHVEVKIQVLDTAGSALTGELALCNSFGTSWYSNMNISFNGVAVENATSQLHNCSTGYIKCAYKDDSWLNQYELLHGMVIQKSESDTAALTEFTTKMDKVLLASKTYTVQVPLAHLSNFFDQTISGQGLYGCRSLTISGVRALDASIGVSADGSAVWTVNSLTIKLNLVFVKPSLTDLALYESQKRDFAIRYTRYKVSTSALSSSTSATIKTSSVKAPVARYCFIHNTGATGDDYDIPIFCPRLETLTQLQTTIGGAIVPYQNKHILASTDFTVSSGNWSRPYEMYLRDFNYWNKGKVAPISYDEFYYAPVIVYRLDNKVPDSGVNLSQLMSESVEIETAMTCGSTTGTFVCIDEFVAEQKFDAEWNPVSSFNTTV